MPRQRLLARVAPIVVAAATLLALGAGEAPTDVPNLGYAQTVSWQVDGAPEVAAMEPTIRSILGRVHVSYAGSDGQPIEGFFPGATYQYLHLPNVTPFYLYARDTATILPMARYYYAHVALRSAVEEFLRLQYADGALSATISPDFKVDKATVVSDEETSSILAAAEAFDAIGDPGWLTRPIAGVPLVDRLNRAMLWVLTHRLDPATQLIKRGHTTDWGDVKWEWDLDATNMQPTDQWTVSIYDQAIAYGALNALARLNTIAGRLQDAARWESEAADLRAASTAVLWQNAPNRGYYRIHVHLLPDLIQHPFDESEIVAIGNAAAVYYGLADGDKIGRILSALERARLSAGAPKVGLTLHPAYPEWTQGGLDPRVYQNGALWDWWGGRQITGEFRSGYSRLATEHLLQVARDWASHPDRVREWESPWLGRTGADQTYAGGATVLGQAVVEGLFGVDMAGPEVRLTPRLGDRSGNVRLYQPATDLYVAYEYRPGDGKVTLTYGSNSPTALSVRMPVLWRGDSVARLDEQSILPVVVEYHGEDVVAVVTVPSGTHKLELQRAPSPRPAF